MMIVTSAALVMLLASVPAFAGGLQIRINLGAVLACLNPRPAPVVVYQQPVYQQPVYQQPVYQQPVYQQPVYQPAYQPTYQPVYVPQPVYVQQARPAANYWEHRTRGETFRQGHWLWQPMVSRDGIRTYRQIWVND
jgi:hypothetical protein